MCGKSTAKFNDEKERIKLQFSDKESTNEISYIDPKANSRIDFGLQFGSGFRFQADLRMLLLNVRHGVGLTNF